MSKSYNLKLKGYVGDYGFDPEYVDYVLDRHKDEEVTVLIDSLGGSVGSALSIAASFRRHGKVSCHFTGMNASAATIAALGAKSVTIEESAMYLVHQCSVTVFSWENMNKEQLSAHIAALEGKMADLTKIDDNVASLYASRCKKPIEDLKAVMQAGRWLTSKEALEMGFVDAVETWEGDAKTVLTEATACAMQDAGLPMLGLPKADEDGLIARIVSRLRTVMGLEENNKNNNNTEMTEQEIQALRQEVADLKAKAEASEKRATEAETRVNALQEELAEAKKKPAEESPTPAVQAQAGGEQEGDNELQEFYASSQRAREMWNAIKG